MADVKITPYPALKAAQTATRRGDANTKSFVIRYAATLEKSQVSPPKETTGTEHRTTPRTK
jgi:hypothetical protein